MAAYSQGGVKVPSGGILEQFEKEKGIMSAID
jgi:hypothetical protein